MTIRFSCGEGDRFSHAVQIKIPWCFQSFFFFLGEWLTSCHSDTLDTGLGTVAALGAPQRTRRTHFPESGRWSFKAYKENPICVDILTTLEENISNIYIYKIYIYSSEYIYVRVYI